MENKNIDFKFDNEWNLSIIELKFDKKPTKKTLLKELKNVKNKYDNGSEFNLFEPKYILSYPFCSGWNSGYRVIFSKIENLEYLKKRQFDETNGFRKIYKL